MTYPYPDKLEPDLKKANDFSEKPPETTINQMADEIVAMIVENEDINSAEELMDFESDVFMESRPVQDLVEKVYTKLFERKDFTIEKRRPSK